MRLYSRGEKESVPLLLYLPQKQSGFLCPPVRIEQTTKTSNKRQKAAKPNVIKPIAAKSNATKRNAGKQNVMAFQQWYRQPLRRKKGWEVPKGFDTLDDEYEYEYGDEDDYDYEYEAEPDPEPELKAEPDPGH